MKGEMAVEFQVDNSGVITGSPKLKVGDGVNTYANLPYVGSDLTEINQLIQAAVKTVSDRLDTLTNGADEAFDTLKEIGDYLNQHMDEYTALLTLVGNKVDKEPGKGLSTNDYTDDDQSKLAGIEAGAQRNTVTGVKGSAETDYRTGNINITKADIGLGNVDNTADANKEVKQAATLKTSHTIDGVNFNGSTDISHYNLCETAAQAGTKEISCANFKLVTGALITVKFKNTNSAATNSVQLNVQNTGEKPVRYRGAVLPSPGTLAANRVYQFIYDGTNYELIGDLDTTYESLKNPYSLEVRAGGTEVAEYIGDAAKFIDIASGSVNGTISVAGTDHAAIDVPVTGLKALAYKESLSKSDVGLGNVDNTADANKEVKTAQTLKVAHTLDGVEFNGSEDVVHYGVCNSAAADVEKVVDIPNFKLVTGASVYVKFAAKNTASVANLALNVSNTGAVNIRRYGTTTITSAGAILANMIVHLVYDGTYWLWVNEMNTNSDTYDREKYAVAVYAETALTKAALAVGINGKYHNLSAGTAFDITYPILYVNSAVAASKTGTDCYIAINFTVTTTQSISLTAYKPVFIKGQLNGTTFTPVSTAPLTQTIPTAEDGYEYILLGVANSGTAIRLIQSHPIYAFIGGNFSELSGNSVTDFSVSGQTVTYIRGDGSTGNFTTQDTRYDVATSSALGLVKSSSGVNKISVSSAGEMSFSQASTDALVQGVNTLILNGGSAS